MSLQETVLVTCPYCGEANDLVIDTTMSKQDYIEDCFVCCRPMVITVAIDGESEVLVVVRTEDA